MSPKDLFVRARASGKLWNSMLVILDASVVVLATMAAYYVRFEGTIPDNFQRWIVPLMLLAMVVYGLLYAAFGQYRLVLRYTGLDTLLKLFAANAIGFAAIVLVNMLGPVEMQMRPAPLGVLLVQAVLVFLGASAARLSARVFLHVQGAPSDARRVLIIGAGSAGSLLLREIQSRPDLGLVVAGFLDDDRKLARHTINGVSIVGTLDQLAEKTAALGVQETFVAMPSAPREVLRRALNAAADAGIPTRVMPAIVLERGTVSLRDLRAVDVEDLLGREPAEIDVEEVRETIAGKTVMVTGAAGSIGSELCRQLVALGAGELILLDVDETRLYEMWLELGGPQGCSVKMCICDIRDAGALNRAMSLHTPAVVLHAAAYKHVPLMELAPAEAIKTNVMGTLQLIEACERHGVERFVLISTDKAVAPANVMGLTKALAERVLADAVAAGRLNAVAVRFGNVLASRGSVVPIFEEQLRHGGPLTVTHPEVTRYFMTIPEAARLVLQAQAIGEPGDVFVLEMGEPVRIVDLARKMIALSGEPAEIRFTGLRPGEKLHEELVESTEKLTASGRAKIMRVDRTMLTQPQFAQQLAALIAAASAGDAEAMASAITVLEPRFAASESGYLGAEFDSAC